MGGVSGTSLGMGATSVCGSGPDTHTYLFALGVRLLDVYDECLSLVVESVLRHVVVCERVIDEVRHWHHVRFPRLPKATKPHKKPRDKHKCVHDADAVHLRTSLRSKCQNAREAIMDNTHSNLAKE